MRFRLTIKEIMELTDNELIRILITERMSGLNVHAPLYKRLQKLYESMG